MTLLEMIKKYEKLKKEMERKLAKEDEFIVDCILEDLHSVEAHPSVTVLCDKILKKIDFELDRKHYVEAQTLASMLSMLPE